LVSISRGETSETTNLGDQFSNCNYLLLCISLINTVSITTC